MENKSKNIKISVKKIIDTEIVGLLSVKDGKEVI